MFRVLKKSLKSVFVVKQKGGDVQVQLVGMDGELAFANYEGIKLRHWEPGC